MIANPKEPKPTPGELLERVEAELAEAKRETQLLLFDKEDLQQQIKTLSDELQQHLGETSKVGGGTAWAEVRKLQAEARSFQSSMMVWQQKFEDERRRAKALERELKKLNRLMHPDLMLQPDMFVGAAPPEPRGIVLRDYQAEALEKLRDGMRQGLRRQMLCLGTGGGKTIIAAALMEAAASKGKRAAFVADRITLVDQTSARLHEAGLAHGVSQGQNRWGHDTLIHVWSSQTMERAFQHRDVLSEYDLVVVDEGHVIRKLLVEAMLESNIHTIGLSATPFSKGLGDIYQGLVNVRTTDQLVEDGWLVPFKIYVGTTIDMAGAKTTGGEWRDSEVSERTLPVIGDIVSEWRKKTHEVFGEGRTPKTLVFSASVANGADLCREFQNIGVRAEQISYRDRDDAVRREKIALFEAGEIDVLTAVDALSKGFDVPSVECIVMARPFRRSLTSIIQQLGRGMRIADSKPYCLLLDNARNYIRFADQDRGVLGARTVKPGHGYARRTARTVDQRG